MGLPSEFKVRQLEREGRLRAVRGVMGSAWYARAEVMAASHYVKRAAGALGDARPRRWTDGDLVALLRQDLATTVNGPARPRTVVDLVAETGVSIERAQRVYRFWLTNDLHPLAVRARTGCTLEAAKEEAATPAASPAEVAPASPMATGGERRGAGRIERDLLIRQLRDPDPRVRAAAFERLKPSARTRL